MTSKAVIHVEVDGESVKFWTEGEGEARSVACEILCQYESGSAQTVPGKVSRESLLSYARASLDREAWNCFFALSKEGRQPSVSHVAERMGLVGMEDLIMEVYQACRVVYACRQMKVARAD